VAYAPVSSTWRGRITAPPSRWSRLRGKGPSLRPRHVLVRSHCGSIPKPPKSSSTPGSDPTPHRRRLLSTCGYPGLRHPQGLTLNRPAARRSLPPPRSLGSGLDFASEADDQPVTVTAPSRSAAAPASARAELGLSRKGGQSAESEPAFKRADHPNGATPNRQSVGPCRPPSSSNRPHQNHLHPGPVQREARCRESARVERPTQSGSSDAAAAAPLRPSTS